MENLKLDVANACIDKGLVPCTEDIKAIASSLESKLEEAGYHNMLEDSIDSHFYDSDHEQLSLFDNK